MRTYRYVQLSTILMMFVSGLHAAVVPKELQLDKYKTAEDIPGAVKWRAVGNGFITGAVEQTMACNYFLSVMATSKDPVAQCVIYGMHWVTTIGLALTMVGRANKKLEELETAERSFMPVMMKMGYDLVLTPADVQALRADYVSLYNGVQFVRRLDAAKVHSNFHSLLQQRVQTQQFWAGALVAAIYGPLCGAAGTAALYKLGLLDTSNILD